MVRRPHYRHSVVEVSRESQSEPQRNSGEQPSDNFA